jgi:hypothetical protein
MPMRRDQNRRSQLLQSSQAKGLLKTNYHALTVRLGEREPTNLALGWVRPISGVASFHDPVRTAQLANAGKKPDSTKALPQKGQQSVPAPPPKEKEPNTRARRIAARVNTLRRAQKLV